MLSARDRLAFFNSMLLASTLATGRGEEQCHFALFKPHAVNVPLNSNNTFTVRLNAPLKTVYRVDLAVEDPLVLQLFTDVVHIPPGSTEENVYYRTTGLKSSVYIAENKTTWRQECLEEASEQSSSILVTVYRMEEFIVFADVLGWIYFAVWTVSFWPQIYLNFRRKSVVGLDFDFLALNLTAFLFYAVYNCSLYFIRQVQREYLKAAPNSVNPVQVQDVAFAIHGLLACVLIAAQCFVYQRDRQRVSRICIVVLALLWGLAICGIIAAAFGSISWLISVSLLSYIKLGIAVVKYIPQVVLNYKRKTTEGFSIFGIFLEFVGSFGSMLQMIVIAYNMDEWSQFLGDFTKLGLALKAMAFDLTFFAQRKSVQMDLTGNG